MDFGYISANGLNSFCDVVAGIIPGRGTPVAIFSDRPDNPGGAIVGVDTTVATLLYHRKFRPLGYSMKEIKWFFRGFNGITTRVVFDIDLGKYVNPTRIDSVTEPIIEEFK